MLVKKCARSSFVCDARDKYAHIVGTNKTDVTICALYTMVRCLKVVHWEHVREEIGTIFCLASIPASDAIHKRRSPDELLDTCLQIFLGLDGTVPHLAIPVDHFAMGLEHCSVLVLVKDLGSETRIAKHEGKDIQRT